MLSQGDLAFGLSNTVLVLRRSGTAETAAVRLVETIIRPPDLPDSRLPLA
jgi:hypothetical protein